MSGAVGQDPGGDSLAADIRSAVTSRHCQGLVLVSKLLRKNEEAGVQPPVLGRVT